MRVTKCPICCGKGFIEQGKENTLTDMKRMTAKYLHKKGFTMRDIQKVLGYKSVSTIKYLLK